MEDEDSALGVGLIFIHRTNKPVWGAFNFRDGA
jgi:hypothetical protein